MKKFFLLFFTLILWAGFNGEVWGQQVIGSFPAMGGGFEGATIDNTVFTSAQTNKWVKNNASTTIAEENSIIRSGAKSLRIGNSTTSGRRVWSPLVTVSSTTSSVTIQLYRRVSNTTNTQESQVGVSNGTTSSEGLSGSYVKPSSADTWEKVTYNRSSWTYTDIAGVIMTRQTGTGGDLLIDDFVMYNGSVDNSAPNSPGAVTVNGATTSSLNVSWVAASGGVDGGGYVVVRYATSPNADNDPNQNGIYAVGNTTTNGTGSLTGTIRYIGTSTSFTDDAGLDEGTTYYYKVYTVDKAFNYSAESSGNGTTSVGASPLITITPTALTGFSYVSGSGPSSEQTFTISGTNLTANISIALPTNYEISTESGLDFNAENPLTLSHTGGTVNETTIYVRLKAGLNAGNYNSEVITATSTGATDKTVTVSGKVLGIEPTTQASDINFTGVSETGFTINWTNGNGANRIVLVKAESAVNSAPVDGTTYTANSAFGSGTQIGTGNYVVYNATSNSISVTGLSASTTYHVAIYEFNGSGGTENYLTSSAATANRSTSGPTVGWQITAVDNEFSIDFDNTVSGVNSGQFAGSGFSPTPSTGQLNSNAWAVTGWSDGDLAFGGTRTISSDYTRGNSNGGVTTGGTYSFLVGTENRAIGFQPGNGDWAPGTLTLKIQNQTNSAITSLLIGYTVYIYNDQGRSNSFNFSHSEDNNTYTDATGLDLTSATTADGTPSWKLYIRNINITGLNIANEGFYYLRWRGADVGGSGSRDEFALDDISIVANPTSVNPSISGTVEEMVISGNSSLSGNLTIQGNLTLNNGTISTGNHVITANNITGGSASSYIKTTGSGGLKRNVPTIESGTLFPVGTESSYNPVTITNSGTADNFTVSVKGTFDNAPVDPTKVVNRQWSISEDTPGGSNATVKLQWNTAEEAGSFLRTNAIYVGHYTGGSWQQTAATYVDLESGAYTAEASGFTSFSPFSIGNENALPVELSSFNAAATNGAVKLTWQTATEVNNYGFQVERKMDKVESIWEEIGFVAGNGNSNAPKDYSYTDNSLDNSGKYSYRLKQIDNDGKTTYSNEIETDVTVVLEYALSQNYPNPFNPSTVINYTLSQPGFVTIKIYNTLGQEVSTLLNGQMDAGKHTLTFDASKLSSGMYLYKITAGNFTQVKKMLLAK